MGRSLMPREIVVAETSIRRWIFQHNAGFYSVLELEADGHLSGTIASVLICGCRRNGSEGFGIAEVQVRIGEVGVV